MHGLRPEYLEAVSAARLNLWLIPVLLAAPLAISVAVLRRWHWVALAGVVLVAAVLTWVSLFAYSEMIWETMEAHAETDAEIDEVTSDTGRVFGPFFLGIPLTAVYCGIWIAVALVARRLLRNRTGPVETGEAGARGG